MNPSRHDSPRSEGSRFTQNGAELFLESAAQQANGADASALRAPAPLIGALGSKGSAVQSVVINEISEWLQSFGANPGPDTWKPRIPELENKRRISYADGSEWVGLESVLATESVSAAADWDEAILWITGWDIYPNHEDWPAYYALRAMWGELRSIETAPGHKFGKNERAVLKRFLAQTMRNGWDAYLLFAMHEIGVTTVVRCSHHQWVEVQSNEPIAHEPFAA